VLADLAAVSAIPGILSLAGKDEWVVLTESESSAYRNQSRVCGLYAVPGFQLEHAENAYYQSLVMIVWRNPRASQPQLVSAASAGDWKLRCIALHLLGTLRREELTRPARMALQAAASDAEEHVALVARGVLDAMQLPPREPCARLRGAADLGSLPA
jgi:hypothetical protein